MSQIRVETIEAANLPVTAAAVSARALARAGLWALFVAHVIASCGTHWDIQWHLLIGRDSFWIPPHVITYSGVTLLVLVSFGVLGWTTLSGGVDDRHGVLRMFGFRGTAGYHLAALGIALTVLAAPIDDLWHRLFGLDVTLWSPPHLLGLFGAIINAASAWLIAREAYPEGHRARGVGIVIAGVFAYGGISVGMQPGIRMAYTYGGVMFFTYPLLGAIFATVPLVITARLSKLRAAPALVLVGILALGLLASTVARVGFAVTKPVSFLAEEIAKEPASPIAVAHEIARKNGTTPGAANFSVALLALLATLGMIAVDARRRPVLASLAFSLVLFAGVGLLLTRLPAFAASLPSSIDTSVALVSTVILGLIGGTIAARDRWLLRDG